MITKIERSDEIAAVHMFSLLSCKLFAYTDKSNKLLIRLCFDLIFSFYYSCSYNYYYDGDPYEDFSYFL